jgi:hypothetical protein
VPVGGTFVALESDEGNEGRARLLIEIGSLGACAAVEVMGLSLAGLGSGRDSVACATVPVLSALRTVPTKVSTTACNLAYNPTKPQRQDHNRV